MPRKVLFSESAIKLIKEAALDSFSLQQLASIPSYAGRLKYCKEQLGNPIGSGSSRTVFQIDDEKVLKLAKNQKGIAQNEKENEVSRYYSADLFPEVYENAEDFSFLVSDFVLPAKPQDFVRILGLKWDEYVAFVKRLYLNYASNRQAWGVHGAMDKERASELLENNEWLYDLQNYMGDYGLPYGDLIRIANYGLTNKGGETMLVILDSGLDEEIFNNYYSRK